MSNTLEEDPIGHTAKFLWIFSVLPLIAQAMVLALPEMSANAPAWARYNGLIAAVVIAGIGLGVHRRSLLVARIGLGIFGLAAVGMAAFALVRAEGNRAGVVLAVLPIWGAIKLHKVCDVLKTSAASAQASPPP